MFQFLEKLLHNPTPNTSCSVPTAEAPSVLDDATLPVMAQSNDTSHESKYGQFSDIVNSLINETDLCHADSNIEENSTISRPSNPATPRGGCTASKINYSHPFDLLPLESYVVLDLETTGLSPQEDHIIDVGLLKVVNGVELDRFSSLVRPPCAIPPFITKLTGISASAVATAPSLEEIIIDIYHFLSGNIVVGHNVMFDLGFLCRAFTLANLSEDINYIDTCRLSRKCLPGLPNYKLSTLIDVYQLAEQQTHRAMDDVLCTDKLLRLCMANVQPTLTQRQETVLTELLNKTVVLTGTCSYSRSILAEHLESLGARISGAVTEKTDYLIFGDDPGSKYDKALRLSAVGWPIRLISEDELFTIIPMPSDLAIAPAVSPGPFAHHKQPEECAVSLKELHPQLLGSDDIALLQSEHLSRFNLLQKNISSHISKLHGEELEYYKIVKHILSEIPNSKEAIQYLDYADIDNYFMICIELHEVVKLKLIGTKRYWLFPMPYAQFLREYESDRECTIASQKESTYRCRLFIREPNDLLSFKEIIKSRFLYEFKYGTTFKGLFPSLNMPSQD